MKPESKNLTQRDTKGRILPGSTGNAGGLTPEQRQARDALGKWLCDAEQVCAGKAAYLRLLEADNPVIVKDFMDRIAGKVKEQLELSGDGQRPLLGMTPRDILEALRGKS